MYSFSAVSFRLHSFQVLHPAYRTGSLLPRNNKIPRTPSHRINDHAFWPSWLLIHFSRSNCGCSGSDITAKDQLVRRSFDRAALLRFALEFASPRYLFNISILLECIAPHLLCFKPLSHTSLKTRNSSHAMILLHKTSRST